MSNKKIAIKNIAASLSLQIVTIICGLITPRLILGKFGSETYGATTSIIQFLSYIALIEGGIGGVARAALYKPLAKKNNDEINSIVNYLKRFFFKVGMIFVAYTLFIAIIYKQISNLQALDQITTIFLVIAISISTFGQYFIGISYSILLQADKKAYIQNILSIVSLVLNTLAVALLIHFDCNIVLVKLVSSIVFVFRPIALLVYAKRKYPIKDRPKIKKYNLDNKWTGIGQHIAYFVHTNTDIVVLTVFSNLKNVAIYSVYSMVISNIQKLIASFGSGMEAIFGELYAKKNHAKLNKTFSQYETIFSLVSVILFSTTGTMLISFITLYTRSINDANYIQETFGMVLLLASAVYTLMLPYHNLVIAAGHFKQTKYAAYGEAIINMTLSIILVKKIGLVGVAIGTVTATTFRLLYYIFYSSKHIIKRKAILSIRILITNLALIIINIIIGLKTIDIFKIDNYISWSLFAVMTVIVFSAITMAIYSLFYPQNIKELINTIKIRIHKVEKTRKLD